MDALAHHPTRRAFLGRAAAAAATVALASCGVEQTRQQTPKRVPRIGYMTGPSSSDAVKQLLESFRGGLREHAYVEGETIQIEPRYSENRPGEWDDFAAEFVGMPVDVIVAPATAAAQQAAMRATKTIPIVMIMSQDPVASGLVTSLARPGGNVTGIAATLDGVSGKRLELLREIVPGIRRVAAIWDGNVDGAGSASLKGAQEAGRELNIEVVELVMRSASDLPGAFKLATDRGVNALLVGPVPFYVVELRREIAMYALERRIPLAAGDAQWAEAGGLVAFGPDQFVNIRRLAYFVDRILKGAKAGELPIEQPAKFETILNLTTAKQLGVTIPPSVLGRATKVIQ
jgi:putative ABC transport system substrate-binding protein